MNTTKKLFLTAGLFLQLSAGLFAGPWEDAFEVFGGAESVFNNRGKMSLAAAMNAVKGGSAELQAVGWYMASGNPAAIAGRFKGAASLQELQAALYSAMHANEMPARSMPGQQPLYQQEQEEEPVQQPASSGGWGWLSSSPSSSVPAISQADVDRAVAAAQKDAVNSAAANKQALESIVSSNKSGASLYFSYIDVLFNLFQQAVNSIADASTQQQVIQYIQNKASRMTASASSNKYSSRIIGRSSSKKESAKKNKRNR